MVMFATGRSPYLWTGRRRLREGRQCVTRYEYMAGLLFVAGASAAAHAPIHGRLLSIRVCALLWFLACVCALVRHVSFQAAPHVSGSAFRTALQYLPKPRRRVVRDGGQKAA